MEIVKDEELAGAAEAIKFDPSKKYTWSADQAFTISGAEFGIILNSLRATLSTEEAQRILLMEKASNIIEATLAAAVEKGEVQEIVD